MLLEGVGKVLADEYKKSELNPAFKFILCCIFVWSIIG